MKQFIVILSAVSILFSSYAQDVNFSATVSKNQVAVGERFQVSFELNTNGNRFGAPSMEDFQVLSGPNQSSSMQWINGTMTSSISFSYVLIPTKEGTLTIGSATIQVGGDTYKTEPITIRATKGAAPQQSQSNKGARGNNQQQASNNTDITDNLFIKLHLDKTKVYQGEAIVATYKIYTRLSIVNNNVNILPTFNGFWAQEIELPAQATLSQEVLNGVTYNSATLKKSILFPQRTGDLDVDALGLDLVVRVQDNSQPRSVFDQFFGRQRDISYTALSNKGKVKVLPLPEGSKPEGFTGAVGEFSLSSTLDKNKVKANEAINLNVTLKGKGNIKLLENLPINFPPDFEVYDPKISDKITTNASGVSGTRNFEYVIIPRHAGDFTIPAIHFSYFNPTTKKYVELETGEILIEVEKGKEEESTTFSSVNKEDVKFLGKDIRFIKSDVSDLKSKEESFFNSIKFWGLFFTPLTLLMLFIVVRKNQKDYNSDVVRVKSRRATKVATKRLTSAKKLLGDSDSNKFYEEIFKALFGYLSDKLTIPIAELSRDTIAEKLISKKVDKELINTMNGILDRCEMARFSPISDVSKETIYEQAVSIISKIEGGIK